jgi:membrane protein implicated in regulation of membrane protease activity
MTWSSFYLICFVVGFAISLLSFLAGNLRWHLPHLPHAGHGALPHLHGSGSGGNAGAGQARGHSHQASPFSLATLAAFLAWFGGAGYLLSRFSTLWSLVGLALAVFAGLLGGGIIFFFLNRVLTSEEENLDPADFEMAGVLGRVSVSIREGGTGEIIYSQAGTRRTCGARSENNVAIAKASEVMVTRYEKGIAYVRLWSEMSGDK